MIKNNKSLLPKRKDWFRRVAKIGFWFFFLKGLLWLIVPAALLLFGLECHSE